MKINALWIAIVLIISLTGGVYASEIKETGAMKMKEMAYGSTIDYKIAYYQKFIHLADSEFKILSDIGKDAIQKISYLKTNRQDLINSMMDAEVKLEKARLNAYLGKRIHNISDTMEAYSTK